MGLALAGAISVRLLVLPPAGLLRHAEPTASRAFLAPGRTTALTPAGRRQVRASAFWGHAYTTSTGETVNVSVSDTYPVDEAVGQSWADYFAGLVHGSELQLIHVYVLAPSEVEYVCGEGSLGCYGSNELVMIGEPSGGIDPKEVAAHEYGHHIAFNRVNAPWVAEDWGTKRWASYANVCRRASGGTAYPGDEGDHYRLNPGEAFAEVYRALNDARAGLATTWPIVDATFYPDAAALQAVEDDVARPWTAPTSRTAQVAFTARGPKVWRLTLRTPLDGQFDAALTMPKGGLYDVSLLAADGSTTLASGLWSGAAQKKLSFTICGQRSLHLRVTRTGLPGRFVVRYSQP